LISRLVPGAESHTQRLSREFDANPIATWTKPEADVVMRCSYRDGNSGWLKDIDLAAEPIVNEMARGEKPVRAVDGALEVFATWAVKMAFVMDCALTPSVLREEDRKRFYLERKPPPDFMVWGRNDGGLRGRDAHNVNDVGVCTGVAWERAGVRRDVPHAPLGRPGARPINESVRPEHDPAGKNVVQLAWPRAEPLEWPLFPRERWLRTEDATTSP
jgi:hypothetical protein